MIRYFAGSPATRKHRSLSTGFADQAKARAQAEFLAETYGGVAKVATSEGDVIAQYSVARGWH